MPVDQERLTREVAIERMSRLNGRNDRIELTILVLTIVMCGGLWALLAGSFHVVASWVGAIVGTVVSGLVAYQKQKLNKALALVEQTNKALIDLKSKKTFSQAEALRHDKSASGEMIRLKYRGRDPKTLTLEERQELEQSYGQ